MHPTRSRPTPLAVLAAALALPAAALAADGGAQTRARSIAATCANCHGTGGHARAGNATLAGMPAEKMLATLADFRSGAQASTIMGQIARGYSDEQLRLAAAWFAAQPAR